MKSLIEKVRAQLTTLIARARARWSQLWQQTVDTAPAPAGKTAEPGPQTPAKRLTSFLGKRIAAVAGIFFTMLVTAVITQTGIIELIVPPACPTSGTLNVGVAAFSAGEGVSPADARQFADLFYRQFGSQLEALDAELDLAEIDMCGPASVASIPGSTPEERANAAAQRASELNLNFLIYGVVERDSETFLEFKPEFFVESVNIDDTVGGSFAFGAPISFSTSRADQALANEELERRTSALLLATQGLVLYYDSEYENAAQFFVRANDEALWPSSRDREVLYVLIGNAAARAGSYDDAEAAYTTVLDLDLEYSRAYLGLGNLSHLKALDSSSCTIFNPDLDLLDEAKAYYDRASRAKTQPPTADVPARVAYGTAQIYLIRWAVQQDDADLREATRLFESVIDAYGDGANLRLKELASESHNQLGLAAQQSGDLMAAIAQYEAALALAESPARRAFSEAQLSRMFRETDAAKADQYAQSAIDDYRRAGIRTTNPEKDAMYWRQIALLYEDLGKLDDAISAMRDAVRLLPEDHICFDFYTEYYESLRASK